MAQALKQRVWHFFEDSTTVPAVIVRSFIVLLILLSAGTAIISLTRPELLAPYQGQLFVFERFVLAVFTIEYIVRFLVSPRKGAFLIDKYNVIDFFAVFPFYIGLFNPTAVRTLRIFRLLRLARLLRVLRLYRAFSFNQTIFQRITPLVLTLVAIKVLLIYLESIGWWFVIDDLGILFTIIGFALGVVLSSKVSIAYKKYGSIENVLFAVQGKLSSIASNIDLSFKKGIGEKLIHDWTKGFVELYNGPSRGSMRKLVSLNKDLYREVNKLGNSELMPHHRLAALLKEIFADAMFIIGRKTTYVPEAYDKLLQQVLLIYLILIALFIPGMQGLIAAALGTYLLYGLYYVTLDLDLRDQKLSLIKLDPKRLETFALELEKSTSSRKRSK